MYMKLWILESFMCLRSSWHPSPCCRLNKMHGFLRVVHIRLTSSEQNVTSAEAIASSISEASFYWQWGWETTWGDKFFGAKQKTDAGKNKPESRRGGCNREFATYYSDTAWTSSTKRDFFSLKFIPLLQQVQMHVKSRDRILGNHQKARGSIYRPTTARKIVNLFFWKKPWPLHGQPEAYVAGLTLGSCLGGIRIGHGREGPSPGGYRWRVG